MDWKLWAALFAATVALSVTVAISGSVYLLAAQFGAQAVLIIAAGFNWFTAYSEGRRS